MVSYLISVSRVRRPPSWGPVHEARCHGKDDELEATELIRRPTVARILSRHRRRLAETARRFSPLFFFFRGEALSSDESRYHAGLPRAGLPSKSAFRARGRGRRRFLATPARKPVPQTIAALIIISSLFRPPCDPLETRENVLLLDEKIVPLLDEIIVCFRNGGIAEREKVSSRSSRCKYRQRPEHSLPRLPLTICRVLLPSLTR